MINPHPATLRAVRDGKAGETVILILAGEDQQEKLTIRRSLYEALGAPAVGTVLDPDTLARARRAHTLRHAIGTALHILEYGDVSEKALTDKLTMRGIPRDAVETAVLEMVKRGYIDEGRIAARSVIKCAAKGWGKRRIHAYLVSRGIPSDTASDAIARAVEAGDVDFDALRRDFISARRARGQSEDAIRRALWRAGF